MSKFCVYGKIIELDRSDYLNIQNLPFNIEAIQTYGRPKYAPIDGCVVATSTLAKGEKKFHLIDPTGSILVGMFDKRSTVDERFETIEQWLMAFVERSLQSESSHFFR